MTIEQLINEAEREERQARRERDRTWQAYAVADAANKLALAKLQALRGRRERGDAD